MSARVLFATAVGGTYVQIASAANTPNVGAPAYEEEWQGFKKQYGKSYDAEEEQRRGDNFRRAMEYITTENAKDHTYKLGINKFADMDSDEFANHYMGFKMPEPAQLWSGTSYLGNHTWNGEDVQDEVDWVAKGAVTPVKDQGHCGSCWIFSAVGSLEGAHQIARGKLVSLAEQQVLDCDHSVLPPTLGCSGGSMGPVYTYAEAHSMCTESTYPYKAKAGTCQASTCTEGVPKGAVTGWKGLAPVGKLIPASIKTMMSAVAQQPVSVSIEADKDVFHLYKSGVVKGSCGQTPDHGVLVVGYGTDTKLGDYWKVKNSWGKDWGEDGYVRIARGVTWRGECAILNSPSYPVVSKTTSSEVVV
jgi:C1A family cysteine protease